VNAFFSSSISSALGHCSDCVISCRIRKGMSPSAFNKCVDTVRAVLEIARELGVI
jgi:hypothetical protein